MDIDLQEAFQPRVYLENSKVEDDHDYARYVEGTCTTRS